MGNFVGYCGLFESLKTSMIQAMKEHVGIEEEWVTPLGQGQKTEEAERDGRFTSTEWSTTGHLRLWFESTDMKMLFLFDLKLNLKWQRSVILEKRQKVNMKEVTNVQYKVRVPAYDITRPHTHVYTFTICEGHSRPRHSHSQSHPTVFT